MRVMVFAMAPEGTDQDLAAPTPEALEARVRALEPEFFVDTLQRLASGDLRLPG